MQALSPSATITRGTSREGITGKTGIKTEDVDGDNFDLVYRINTKGIFHFCKVSARVREYYASTRVDLVA
jgi:hypothetical protein